MREEMKWLDNLLREIGFAFLRKGDSWEYRSIGTKNGEKTVYQSASDSDLLAYARGFIDGHHLQGVQW